MKGDKELHPCLGDECGWFSYTKVKCGIKAIADDSLLVSIDSMPDVYIRK